MSSAVKQLFETGKGSQEVYFDKLTGPDARMFTTFAQLLRAAAIAEHGNRRIPIGVRRGSEIILNPRNEEEFHLKRDDEIIVLADLPQRTS